MDINFLLGVIVASSFLILFVTVTYTKIPVPIKSVISGICVVVFVEIIKKIDFQNNQPTHEFINGIMMTIIMVIVCYFMIMIGNYFIKK